MGNKIRIGALISGGGTNLQAIIDKIEDGTLSNCTIVTVVSSKAGVYALERAQRHDIPAACISRKSTLVNRQQSILDPSLHWMYLK